MAAGVVCDSANNESLIFDQIFDAKSYCARNDECIGIQKHLNDTYTPGCKRIITSANDHWMSKYACIKG